MTPAIGIGGWYWPLAAARALGLAGLDTDVKGLFADWRAQFLRLQSFADACASGRAPTADAIPAQSAELALPLQFPNKLVAIGANYAHLAEMGAAIVKTPHPVCSSKPPTTAMVGPGKLFLPEGCRQFDWEVELARDQFADAQGPARPGNGRRGRLLGRGRLHGTGLLLSRGLLLQVRLSVGKRPRRDHTCSLRSVLMKVRNQKPAGRRRHIYGAPILASLAASPPGFLVPALGGERLPDIGL